MKRELTCIVCPLGCKIEVGFAEEETKEIEYIKGNTCKRGAEYAQNECTHPTRVITSTVLCDDGSVIPVKTSMPIPKEKIFECMDAINSVKAVLPICAGDVIIKNVLNTDADVVSTVNRQS